MNLEFLCPVQRVYNYAFISGNKYVKRQRVWSLTAYSHNFIVYIRFSEKGIFLSYTRLINTFCRMAMLSKFCNLMFSFRTPRIIHEGQSPSALLDKTAIWHVRTFYFGKQVAWVNDRSVATSNNNDVQ